MYYMSFTSKTGRLGNQMIRNLAVSLIAEKFNLKVDYVNKELMDRLGLPLFSGSTVHSHTLKLTDENYFIMYDQCHSNLDPNDCFFQTKEITNFLYTYLQTVKTSMIQKNNFKPRYQKNNDLFIHVRLTDVAQYNPGIQYYLNVIRSISFDNLYLATDDKHHPIIKEIAQLYPVQFIESDEIITMQFASTCKHIVLSHGSFSSMIGYLSFFSDVYYPEYHHTGKLDFSKNIWFGDMFSIPNWVKCKV